MNFKTKLNLEYHQARKAVLDEFEKSVQESNKEYEIFLEEVAQLFVGGKFRREFFKCKTQALIMLNKEHETAQVIMRTKLELIELQFEEARRVVDQVAVSVWFQGDDKTLPTYN